MATWAIGDLQGCHDTLQALLEKLRFDPAVDRLWFCGDLVNRGGQSLETLRLVKSLDACSTVVLGNHDLSLVAIGERREDEQRKVNPDLQRVLFAPDRDALLHWLRMRPLMHVDRPLGWMMVHAGLAPKPCARSRGCSRAVPPTSSSTSSTMTSPASSAPPSKSPCARETTGGRASGCSGCSKRSARSMRRGVARSPA